MTFVALDLDGTILRADATASARTIAVLERIRRAGVVVAICTARSQRSALPIAHELGLRDGFAICGSGSVVADVASGRLVHRNEMPLREARALVEKLRERIPGVAFSAEVQDTWHRETHYVTTLVPPIDIVVRDDALEFLEGTVTKVNIRHPELDDDGLFGAVTHAVAELGLSHVISAAGFVEVLGPGIDKAVGVAWVADAIGATAADTLAFGDDRPDIPMIAWAGRGIAVANAHPDVLAIADEVCGSVDDDGVAEVLESLAP